MPTSTPDLRAIGAHLRKAAADWRRDEWAPRAAIARLLPSAGTGLVVTVAAINVVLGLLPVAFILATSTLLGAVPDALRGGDRSAAFERLSQTFVVAAACFLAQQMLALAQASLGERIRRRVDGELRDRAMELALRSSGIAPLEHPETLSALSEATRLFELGGNTPGRACAGLLALIARYARLLALLVIIAHVGSWPLAAALGGVTMMFRYGQRTGLRKYSAVWREVASVNRRSDYLREVATGAAAAKEIRVFGLQSWLGERYRESFLRAHEPIAARRRQIYQRPYRIFTPIGAVVAASVAIVLSRDAALGNTSLVDLAIGIQALMLSLSLGEFYPESDVPTQFGMQTVAALEEVERHIERLQTTASSAPHVASPDTPARSLSLDGVCFGYPGNERSVLNDFTLDLPVGKCTAIVGVNGAGKTTLVKLLTRLYEPTAGAIRADGVDISRMDLSSWRGQVSVVFQDFVRYELSAADNIALRAASGPADREGIAKAARDASILEAFARHPLGLDAPLSRAYAGGMELSGGQWQRIAIARALHALRAGARVLILDEPTSALDVRAETEFFDQFVDLTQGATSILISHRFSSVRRADLIVVMDGGRVVEKGTHTELLGAGGVYAHLFRLQAERFVAEQEPESGRHPIAAAASAGNCEPTFDAGRVS